MTNFYTKYYQKIPSAKHENVLGNALKMTCALLVLVVLSGCGTVLQIERHQSFNLKKNRTRQIVSINPSFKISGHTGQKNSRKGDAYSEVLKNERLLNELLKNNAKKNGIVLQIMDTDDLQNNDGAYFKYLAPLRKEILQVNYLQDFKEINEAPVKANGTGIFYEQGPKISTHYSHLAEVYGTPYFAIQGVSYQTANGNNENASVLISDEGSLPAVSASSDLLYFTLIADVSRSQIVYREYRNVGADVSESNLSTVIFDSFKIIAN